jgi:site-specific recombinase XerC
MVDKPRTPLDRQISSFRRWLTFENKSEKTIDIYVSAARKAAAWLADAVVIDEEAGTEHRIAVNDWADATSKDVQEFIISVLNTKTKGSAGYASNLFRALQQFSKWWASEEGKPDPMFGLKPPMIPEQDPVVLRADELKALIKSCEGREFVQRRDMAIIMMFMDTGLRRVELTDLGVDDLDLDYREATVLGKGRRTRSVAFGRKAAWALDRYVDERSRHRQAELKALWLGEKGKGPMTASGIFQMIQRRGAAVGIDGLHPHVLRHTWVHFMKTGLMADDEIMKLAGWRSASMLRRYASTTASERARESGRRLAPGDRL